MRTDETTAALFAHSVRFGNYEIPVDPVTGDRRELGRGGMGVTYLARDRTLGRIIVLKVVSRALRSDSVARKRFLREARALAFLKHPAIPVLYEFGEVDGDDFYTMEFIAGEDLNRRIKRDGPLPLVDALWVAEQAAGALSEAHQAGIIHRDVKPGNLMITGDPSGKLPEVRLIDFGLAKDTGGEADLGASATGESVFTPLYASPEQVKGEAVTHAADIYSLGVSLWFLLTGNPPFRGTSKYEVEIKHVSEPPPVQSLPPVVPPPVRELLAAMLAKDPAERPASAEELAQSLRSLRAVVPAASPAALAGSTLFEAPTYHGGNTESRTRKTGQTQKRPVSGSASASTFVDPARETQRTERRPPPAPSKLPVIAGTLLVALAMVLIFLALRPPPAEPTPQMPSVSAHTSGTLSMPFVRVKGANALFGVWKVRVRDFDKFAKARKFKDSPIEILRVVAPADGKGAPVPDWKIDPASSWQKPGFEQKRDHPVVGVSWEEAREFCRWLTETEQAEKRIPAGAKYRLPTDAEWSAAAGSQKYPWGDTWPPPAGVGNFCDTSAVEGFPPLPGGAVWPQVPGKDGYARTSPVGIFAANANGLFDLAGNVWEWCEDTYKTSMNAPDLVVTNPRLGREATSDGKTFRVVRGGSWFTFDEAPLRSNYRDRQQPTYRGDRHGFRVVYDPGVGR